MYHPGTPRVPQFLRCCSFSCTITFIPGGAGGVLLKSNCPSIAVCADIFGFIRQGLRIFKGIVACGISQHHRCIEKRVFALDIHVMK